MHRHAFGPCVRVFTVFTVTRRAVVAGDRCDSREEKFVPMSSPRGLRLRHNQHAAYRQLVDQLHYLLLSSAVLPRHPVGPPHVRRTPRRRHLADAVRWRSVARRCGPSDRQKLHQGERFARQ